MVPWSFTVIELVLRALAGPAAAAARERAARVSKPFFTLKILLALSLRSRPDHRSPRMGTRQCPPSTLIIGRCKKAKEESKKEKRQQMAPPRGFSRFCLLPF